jgi:signal transduction histidine kinase
LTRKGTRLRIEVYDDGSGFDASAVPGGQAGLANIRDRVAAVHGLVEVDSASGRGTRLVVELPTSPEAVPEPGVEEPAHA